MTLGAQAGDLPCDLAYVSDVETLERQGEALLDNAAFVLVPTDLHAHGWASGRSLASWGADIPALARLREQGRLVAFELWTGSPHGIEGDFASDDVPRRLLAKAGVLQVTALGLSCPAASIGGFGDLESISERVAAGA